jgi:hypothetical protein
MKIAHVVGNGPSWVDFKRLSDQDFVIGCNVTKVQITLHAPLDYS